jgi:hypothetical protein
MCMQLAAMAIIAAGSAAAQKQQSDAQATRQRRMMRQQEAEYKSLMDELPTESTAPTQTYSSGISADRRKLAVTKGGTVVTSPLGVQSVPGAKKSLLGGV